jgi:hypothetical protein
MITFGHQFNNHSFTFMAKIYQTIQVLIKFRKKKIITNEFRYFQVQEILENC